MDGEVGPRCFQSTHMLLIKALTLPSPQRLGTHTADMAGVMAMAGPRADANCRVLGGTGETCGGVAVARGKGRVGEGEESEIP